MNGNVTEHFRILHHPAEAAMAKRDAYTAFMGQLQGTGLTVTDEAALRWWGLDFSKPKSEWTDLPFIDRITERG